MIIEIAADVKIKKFPNVGILSNNNAFLVLHNKLWKIVHLDQDLDVRIPTDGKWPTQAL